MKAGCILLVLMAATAGAGAATGASARASGVGGPWERSVELEKEGDVRGAEAALMAAWGKKPDNFYAQLRLAYLALISERAGTAVARYRRARRFPEAKDDEDVVAGYAAALALKGWQRADAGRLREARVLWQKALTIDPEQADAGVGLRVTDWPIVEPEAWGAVVGQSFGSGRYQGLVAFGQIPWRVLDVFTLRAAARHIAWRQISAVSPWAAPGQSAARWTVDEIYGGAGYDTTLVTAEALGFAVWSPVMATISGAGLRLRVGRRWGALADVATLRMGYRWANQQARSALFLAVGDHLVLHAGGRLTREEGGSWLSGVAGALLLGGPFMAYAQGHVGPEHWAANLGSPSILSIVPRTRRGAALTLSWDAMRALRFAGQAEVCSLTTDGATGLFWSLSLGVQLRVFDS
jgi:tetratricopeptide (TPR) repeat protein